MDALLISKVVLATGFALWFFVNVLNHFQDWKGAQFFVTSFMKMSALDEDPVIPTLLKKRRVEGGVLPVLVFVLITLCHAVIGLAYAVAATMFVLGSDQASEVAMLASAAAAALWFLFIVGGTWFAYWLKFGDLQRTHLMMLGIAMMSMLIFNL